ncbi:MAG: hypothetical protein ACE37F_29050 [Nannocystaceae bacterium]|nr:hypothetical protein [bacterium]
MRVRASDPVALGLLGFVVACAFWVPGLGEPGLWSEGELPVFDRARAALGEALSGLERSPALPDAIRTRGVAILGGALGLRLPHMLAAAAVVGLAVGWLRSQGRSVALSLLGGAVALSLPMLSLSGRTALGNPFAELFSVAAVLSLLVATRPNTSMRGRAAATLVGTASLGAGVASTGLLLGAALPLTVVALTSEGSATLRAALALLAAVAVGVSLRLALEQGDGFIPLLGAAKDLELLDKPQARRFADGLEDFGYQLFPWAGLAMVGAATGKTAVRVAAIWLVVALAYGAGWSLLYGPIHQPIAVPAAACVVAAVATVLDPAADGWARRVSVFVGAAAALVIAKDAKLSPNRLVAPTELRDNEHTFPGDALEAEARVGQMGKAVFFAIVAGGLLGRRREEHGLERLASKVPGGARDLLIVGAFTAAAVSNAWMHAHVLLPRTAALFSPKIPLQRLAGWVERGTLPATLGVHRVRDRGLLLYGPQRTEVLTGRRDLTDWFVTDEPAAALIRKGDYAALFQSARQDGRPLFVLDDSHARLRLVANRLPEGAENLDPLVDVVLDEPPGLEHETLLNFDGYIEIIGWELDGPLRRGKSHTLQVAIRVLRPLPAGSKLYARMLKGRLSRIGGEAHDFVDGLYPTNFWRKGDIIWHRWTFETPPLEILPGEYDVLLGLRRSEQKNFTIRIPEGKTGQYGVEVRGRKREFAKIGTVTVW